MYSVQLTAQFTSRTDCIVFEACRFLLLGRAIPASLTSYISDQLVTNEFVCMLLTSLNTFQKTLRAENFVIAVGGRPRFPEEVSFKNGVSDFPYQFNLFIYKVYRQIATDQLICIS